MNLPFFFYHYDPLVVRSSSCAKFAVSVAQLSLYIRICGIFISYLNKNQQDWLLH